MANVRTEVNVRWDRGRLNSLESEFKRALKIANDDCVDDLIRTSSETSPHDKGILDSSFAKSVTESKDGFRYDTTVEYSVREGGYNYAIAMHELEYNLGANSQAKGGGIGMSGTHYPVGNKYLTRPLEGEKEAYRKHIEEVLKTIVRRNEG